MTAQNIESSENGSSLSQFDVLNEISKLLNTGISKETLQVCIELIEAGINPLALADFVKSVTEHCSK